VYNYIYIYIYACFILLHVVSCTAYAAVEFEDTMCQIEKLRLNQYETYVEETVSQKIPIAEPLKRNNLHLSNWPPIREKSSKQLQLSSLKNSCSLFSTLYITSQICNGDLGEFYKHENQPYPPAVHCHRWML